MSSVAVVRVIVHVARTALKKTNFMSKHQIALVQKLV